MATPETIAEQEGLQGINSDYTEKYGFHDAENYLYKAPMAVAMTPVIYLVRRGIRRYLGPAQAQKLELAAARS